MDWDRFQLDYRLDTAAPRLQGLLVQIEGYREAARNLVLPSAWKERLDRLNRIRAIRGTTGLEGNPLSEQQVARVLDDETRNQPNSSAAPSRSSAASGQAAGTVERQQVRNAAAAQEWVRSRFGHGSPPLATDDILRMHRLMTVGSDEIGNLPGRLRTHDVQVGTPALGGVHRGAPHPRIERLTAEFVEFVGSPRMRAEHPVVRALLAHFFLVTIHPFGDGNGRVSRLVEAAVLYEGGYNVHGFYGLSNFFYVHGDKYKLLLQECRCRQPFDLAPFVEFGLEGFAHELRGINNFIQTKMNGLVYRDMMTRAISKRVGKRRKLLNRREYSLLLHLLEETEPEDPFAAEPSRAVLLAELLQSPFVLEVYRHVTRRTFVRELERLNQFGFIRFENDPVVGALVVAIDFGAIERH